MSDTTINKPKRRYSRHSYAAESVAKEVIETIRKGQKPVLRRIIPKYGYSKSVADRAVQVTQTQSYQAVINPVIALMERERLAALRLLEKKRDKAYYNQLVDGIDKLTKNIQLLSGGATENVAVAIPSELLDKNNILPDIVKSNPDTMA